MAVANKNKYSTIKEIIREKIGMFSLLEHYGVDIPQRNVRYGKVRIPCCIHDGDSPSGMSIDINSKQFTCFTKHCGEHEEDWFWIPKDYRANVPRDVFLFIKLMEEKIAREEGRKNYKCSFTRALEIASEVAGIKIEEGLSYDKNMIDKLDNQRWMREMAVVTKEIELSVFSEDDIELYKAQLPIAHDYIECRDFDDDTLDFFEFGYSLDGVDEPYHAKREDFSGRIILPIRDEEGRLVGWSGRLATDDKSLIKRFHKWMHKLDFDKGFVLYNFNNAKEYIESLKEIIIVEGPFDVIRLWSYGIYNVVAVMGSALTPEQLSIAVSSSLKAYVMLDQDEAGQDGSKKICEQLKPYVDVYNFLLPSGKDPDKLTFEEAWDAISNPKKYVG